jgi:gliding motility-associatede transport system auxiliary component
MGSKGSDRGRAWTWLADRFSSMSHRALAWGSLALAAVILLSVNLISSIEFRNWQADMTQEKLFTISDGTKEVLRGLDEPIKVRLYFSKQLGEASPRYASYFERVKSLLENYRDISGGKLEVSYFDPEPFSVEEDRAVAAGLKKVAYNAEGDVAYFGLNAVNSTDNQQTIDFFYPDRETFLEYDVTKLIYTLADPKKKVVGVITGLPIDGETDPRSGRPTPPWLIMQQIRELFDVRMLDQDTKSIPQDVDVLMVVQPGDLTPQASYAIDQYMLGGGRALVLIDPVSEMTQLTTMGKKQEGLDQLVKLLKAWGVAVDRKQVAADIEHAQRVRYGPSGETVTDYVAWLNLDGSNMVKSDVLSAGIETLNLASAGVLHPADGAKTTVTPIIETSEQGMIITPLDVGIRSDPVNLLRSYKPGGKPLILAVRVSGVADSAFPDGAPASDAKKGAADAAPSKDNGAAEPANGPRRESGKVNAIVIADSDLMADRFWVQGQEILGQRVVVPTAQNAALILGALENLTGSDALIALRGRGVGDRPFTLVEQLRRDAERRYRETEQQLTNKLKKLQGELAKIESPDTGTIVLTGAERDTAEKFRADMIKTRRELRDVRLALRRDIDRLDGWLKFANIALVPIAVAAGGVGWSLWRSRRRKDKKKGHPEVRS